VLAGHGPVVVVRGTRWRLLLNVRKARTVHAAVHHDCSLKGWKFLSCDAGRGLWVSLLCAPGGNKGRNSTGGPRRKLPGRQEKRAARRGRADGWDFGARRRWVD